MKIQKNLVICLLGVWIESCICTFYMTPFEIGNFLRTERNIINSLNGYISRQEKRGITFDDKVKQFLDYADTANNGSDVTDGPDNPLSVFYHLYRGVEEWQEFAESVSCKEERSEDCPILTGEDVIIVGKRREGARWPTEVDLKYAAKTIINVWLVYDLDLDQVITGNLGNITERPLTADQIFFIANAARDAGMTYEAITWFEYLLEKWDSFSDVTLKQSVLYRRISISYHEIGMNRKAKDVLTKMSIIDPEDKGVSRDLEYLNSRGNGEEDPEFVRFPANDTSKSTLSRQQYEKLCKTTAEGELHYNFNLTCSLVPLQYFYGVVKVELVSRRPRIEIIHDVLSANETKKIVSYADQFFPNPKVKTEQGLMISRPMCEYNQRCPLVRQITRRLKRMTRFQMYQLNEITSSQCYELMTEGTGVVSKTQTDFWDESTYYPHPFAGNRLATIYMQLTDIEYGGALVFPKVNVTVPVQKGSAVVWWNLKRNGRPSLLSAYQRCPVLQGSQWALVKRILYTNQIFARNCDRY